MHCPNCGHELEEGYLYCTVCGEEIHMVPNFEPEIEDSIHEMLHSVAEEVTEDVSVRAQEQTEESKKNDSRWYGLFAAVGFGIVFLLLVSFAGIWYFQSQSLNYQMSKAAACVSRQDFQKAAGYYEKALELDENNCDVRFQLADIYYTMGREEDAILRLKEIIEKETAAYEEVETAYAKIIAIYKTQESYALINELLSSCEHDEVLQEFQEYLVTPPQFSYATGTYEEVIPLKLSTNAPGKIYYTLDGSTPSEQSLVYTSPIYLESGSHVVNAYFVNDYGVKSQVVSNSYYIDIESPAAPEISAYSGDYEFPVMIRAEAPPNCDIYYSMDGTTPKQLYTEPIPMPIGKNRFDFVSYSKEGAYSEVVSRSYHLRLHTDITDADAEQLLIDKMIEAGRINDEKGNIWETGERRIYDYRYVVAIEDKSDYYIIGETFINKENQTVYSEPMWAVDVYSGGCFRLSKDEEGKLTVDDF